MQKLPFSIENLTACTVNRNFAHMPTFCQATLSILNSMLIFKVQLSNIVYEYINIHRQGILPTTV